MIWLNQENECWVAKMQKTKANTVNEATSEDKGNKICDNLVS